MNPISCSQKRLVLRKSFRVDQITISVKEEGEGVFSNGENIYSNKTSIGEFINCSNPLCYGGGINIGNILRQMVREKQVSFENSEVCRGNEGSPKGKRVYRKCLNLFRVSIKIKYKT